MTSLAIAGRPGWTGRPLACAPVSAVNALLAAAMECESDLLYIEPVPLAEDHYLISLERGGDVIATSTLDGGLATAVIARLAILCEVDLIATRASTGTTRVRCGGNEADVVLTIRPGPALRAEALFVRRGGMPVARRDVTTELAVGDIVEHYRIVEHLGEGGMGTVYQVQHNALGRTYALKVLKSDMLRSGQGAAERFLREARAAARIHHPNIVDVFDFGYLGDGRPYFVMEMLTGQSLADMLDGGPLEPGRAVAIARQLAGALVAAHERGVIHADVTPSNVLVEDAGDPVAVKLVDFGLAEVVDDRPERADEEFVYGTPCYVSPEQIRGEGATQASDQYSLGIIMFELLTGKPPFQHDNLRSLCFMHLRDPMPPMASPHGELPAELVALVKRCLTKSPIGRFPTMRDVASALEQVDRTTYRRGWRKWLAR